MLQPSYFGPSFLHFEFSLATFLTHSLLLLFLLSRLMFHFQLFQTFLFVLLLLLLVIFIFFVSARVSKAFFRTSSMVIFSFPAIAVVPGFWLRIQSQPLSFFHQVLLIHFCLVFVLIPLCLWLLLK